MSGILLICSTLLAFNAKAGKITMSNPDAQVLKGGKRLCTYENSIYLFTYVTKGECKYTKTFDTSGNEK